MPEWRLKVLAGVLAARIAVVYQFGWPPSTPERHQQHIGHHLRIHRIAHRPANDAVRVQVYGSGNEQPAFSRPDVGNIGDPFLVRRIGFKPAVKVIRRNAVSYRAPELLGMRCCRC